MSDPYFDEESILALLHAPVQPDNVIHLQRGVVQALLNCWDRDVTRDEFISMAAPMLVMYGATAKLSMLDSIERVYKSGELDDSKFIKAHEQSAEHIKDQVKLVVDIVRRVRECPTSADVIH